MSLREYRLKCNLLVLCLGELNFHCQHFKGVRNGIEVRIDQGKCVWVRILWIAIGWVEFECERDPLLTVDGSVIMPKQLSVKKKSFLFH